MNTCKNCSNNFKITDSDKVFYNKVNVPEPTFCPDCRLQRRYAFRNERYIFKRKCDKCEKDIISMFREKEDFPVYCSQCWWGDGWDPKDYAMKFDFSRPFFDQYFDLLRKVPKMGMTIYGCENSPYNTLLAYCKNTYMSPGSYFCEDVYYLNKSQYCKDCANGIIVDHSELTANAVNSANCYNAAYLENCKNCSDSFYMSDCIGCSNCFMCSNVIKKQYNYKNKKYTKEEYKKIVDKKMKQDPKELKKEFFEFRKTVPKKYQNVINCENCSGDYLQNCNNAFECYDSIELEDVKYAISCVDCKDSMDITNFDKENELCYETITGGDANVNTKFSFCPVISPDCTFVYTTNAISNCFGCDGLHSKEKYHILNKKYSQEEYEEMVPKIIEHMKKHGEWGEFFPVKLSLFPYNHTVANDYFPMNKEEVLAKKWQWQDKDIKEYKPATYNLVISIDEVPDSVVDEILACEDCGKNYKILAQELKLHRKIGIPLSKKCGDCRKLELESWKNPRRLYDRKCDKCSVDIKSTYAVEKPEKVYCEKCYLDSLS